MQNNTQTVSGTIVKITYKNENNGYCVLTLNTGSEDITVVGIIPNAYEGEFLNCTGQYIHHKTYGSQFKVEFCERVIKEDSASILKYLSSGSVRGIGPATARKIVEQFGKDSLDIIENYPEKLCIIKGISYEKAMAVSEHFKSQFGIREILLKFSQFNFTPAEALKIFKKLGNNAVPMVQNNPYVLCSDNIGFDFLRAEEIAEAYNLNKFEHNRILAGVKYVLKKNTANSHTCLPINKLADVSSLLLDVEPGLVKEVILNAEKSLELILEDFDNTDFVFLPEYHSSERYIASRIKQMAAVKNDLFSLSELEIDRAENILSIKFEELQRQAVRHAVENGVFILTGGPGTGKTTTLNAIISVLEHRGLDVMLCAPTGRAARRITELTGIPAKTIHRMLEAEFNEDEKHFFARNEKNPLECDVLIVDEMSMVDTFLFEAVLRAVKGNCRIIMVGDTDQLPSVGAGNVLHDLIKYGNIASVCLKTIFRQAEESLIVTNAHKIINGKQIVFNNSKNSDCFMLINNNPEECVSEVVNLLSERLPLAYGFLPLENIQVLCPSRRFLTGTANLNNLLQAAVNPPSKLKGELSFKGITFRQGDKVMQIKNNYDILWETNFGETGSGVFNGDIGFIESADGYLNSVTVNFDGKRVIYSGEEIAQLELAYAVTVHKSQGSEFDCIILPLLDVPHKLRYRNLLYTAFTRAKQLLVVVGSSTVLADMIANDKKTLRYTGLLNFLMR